MNEAIIKPFSIDQTQDVITLLQAQLDEHSIDSSSDALTGVLRTLSEQPQYGFILTAVCGGSLVGVAYVSTLLSLEHGGWSGWLEEFYVLPEYRGRGLGTQLLTAAITAATERGFAALDLEVDTGHQRVVSLYVRHGFTPVHRTRHVRRA